MEVPLIIPYPLSKKVEYTSTPSPLMFGMSLPSFDGPKLLKELMLSVWSMAATINEFFMFLEVVLNPPAHTD